MDIKLLCKVIGETKESIKSHLKRGAEQDHSYIEEFQKQITEKLNEDSDYKWEEEYKINYCCPIKIGVS